MDDTCNLSSTNSNNKLKLKNSDKYHGILHEIISLYPGKKIRAKKGLQIQIISLGN